MFHHGLVGMEYLMNYEFSFAEEYFKGESNHEDMTTLMGHRKDYLKTIRKRRMI